MLQVERPVLEEQGERCRVAGRVGGVGIWFDLPADTPPRYPSEAFLGLALMPAMKAGEPVALDEDCAVSSQFLRNLHTLQTIYELWHPALSRIEVRARTVDTPAPCRPGGMSFYSGGVDSVYTFLENLERLDHALFVRGIDMQLDNEALWKASVEANRETVEASGKRLLTVTTNARFAGHEFGFGWSQYEAPSLGALALLFGFETTLIPASHTYAELFPWGSHPLTDPLWTAGTFSVEHHGALRRSDKLRTVGRHPEVLDRLRVCWQDRGYNCGRCEKCVRTAAALKLLGLESRAVPVDDVYERLRKVSAVDPSSQTFVVDLIRLAESVGDARMLELMRRERRRYLVRRALVDLDRAATGGAVKRLAKRLLRRPA